jgi:RimJ/RimL family protein N-acetyltransferase
MFKLKIIKSIEKREINFLYKLRNKNYVRNNSFEKKKISFKKHIEWSKKFETKNNKLFLIQKSNDYIGYIRMEYKNKILETSWALLSKFKGQGIMTSALKKATSKKYGTNNYRAFILNDNLPSIQIAKKCNFEKIRVNKNFKVYKKIVKN